MSRSYYRGAAGAVLVYDITSHNTFSALPAFLNDARALASPNLTLLLVGNKLDLTQDGGPSTSTSNAAADLVLMDGGNGTAYWDYSMHPPPTPSSLSSSHVSTSFASSSAAAGLGSQLRASVAPEGREVMPAEANRWASAAGIPVAVEVSALSGEGVDDVFGRLARMILTKIELGEIDPDDPMSGIQYGDAGPSWGGGAGSDVASIKSSMTVDDLGGGGGGGARRRRGGGRGRKSGMALREWEEVFTLSRGRRGSGCC